MKVATGCEKVLRTRVNSEILHFILYDVDTMTQKTLLTKTPRTSAKPHPSLFKYLLIYSNTTLKSPKGRMLRVLLRAKGALGKSTMVLSRAQIPSLHLWMHIEVPETLSVVWEILQ